MSLETRSSAIIKAENVRLGVPILISRACDNFVVLGGDCKSASTKAESNFVTYQDVFKKIGKPLQLGKAEVNFPIVKISEVRLPDEELTEKVSVQKTPEPVIEAQFRPITQFIKFMLV